MNAIDFLKKEHETAKAAFGKVLQASPEQRGAQWRKLAPELKAHEEMEDVGLYQPLAVDAAGKDERLAEWRQKHQGEVKQVESLIKDIERLDPKADAWLSKIKEVHGSLENHIREEEGDVFPRISRFWDQARLDRAGREMGEMKARKARAA